MDLLLHPSCYLVLLTDLSGERNKGCQSDTPAKLVRPSPQLIFCGDHGLLLREAGIGELVVLEKQTAQRFACLLYFVAF